MRASLLCLSLLIVSCSSPEGEEEPELEAAVYPDEDGDTIMDHHEGVDIPEEGGDDIVFVWHDDDLDGEPNYMDLDSDNDGIEDSVEAGDADLLTFPIDTDLDGLSDFLDTDSDDNCVRDKVEGTPDADSDGLGAYVDLDNDGDNILDTWEIGDLEVCEPPDTDEDGTPNYEDIDSDGDGIGDFFEAGTSEFDPRPGDTDGDGTPDYLDLDSDDDGMSDTDEGRVDSPTDEPKDTDGDGFYDFQDIDSDNDGLTDSDEILIYDTDPYNYDSDDDGFNDGAEVSTGSDPTDPDSVIEGIYVEVPERSDVPNSFDFELSVKMGDVAFLLDTTGSMGGTIDAMKSEYSAIVAELASTIPDAEYGVATFDDYNYGGFGSGSDKPFIMKTQVTSDTARVQSVISGIPLHGGADWAESTTEALYQALTGNGYDQNCNGSYDGSDDVMPFLANGADPFSGSGGQHFSAKGIGGGQLGGMGFRDYALPVVVYATDAPMRDASVDATPGGCPYDATGTGVADAANELGAYLIGVCVSGTAAKPQMQALADATGSLADLDGDGIAAERLVFEWTGSSAAFRTTITEAINSLISSVRFEEITLEIEGDDWGFVTGIDPMVHVVAGAISGETISFDLTFRGTVAATEQDQLFQLTLNVLGDGTTLLDTLDIFVLVPGTA